MLVRATRLVLSRQQHNMKFVSPLSTLLATSSLCGTTINGFSPTAQQHHQNHLIRPASYSTTTTLLNAGKKRRKQIVEESSSTGETEVVTAEFASEYHAPVMWRECINSLLACGRGDDNAPLQFVDATLGGGGHSLALLQKLSPGDVVFGCDVDTEALATASTRLKEYMHHDGTEKALFVPVQSNFCNLATAVPQVTYPDTEEPIATGGVIDGILMDLGVSSHQINTAERGFAFLKDGPLDMRMNSKAGITAADILNEFGVDEIRRILKQYGDEPRAKSISLSIVDRRPLSTTKDLVEAVAAVVPEFARKGRRMGRTATLARVFQALRIVVNQEDKVLTQALMEMCPALIKPGGRLVVLSYHSMEDRATKRVMRDGTTGRRPDDKRDVYGNYIGTPRPWKTLGKPQKATDEEVELNSRARSATLRVAERASS